mmetsp:Transcript_781/g.2230  ORF Transcript_781/g.2230 Transcript_781/m.2230 type:complete len:451 (+) Transcript_781:25-1377(+)
MATTTTPPTTKRPRFSAWKIGVKKVVLRVVMWLAGFVDVVVFDVLGVSGPSLLRWWLKPARLRAQAVRLAGCSEEKYHVATSEIDARLRRSVEAVASADETLGGCGKKGGGLRVGLVAVRALERRLVRQLVVDLLVTASSSTTGEDVVEDPLVIVGPQRSGTTVLLELLGKDTGTWRQLKTHEATLPLMLPQSPRALLDAGHEWLAGVEVVLDGVRHVHHERWDGPVECRTALENGVGAPYALWYIFGAAPDLWPQDQCQSDYLFYRTQLQSLSDGSRRRWLLKDPVHCLSLDALFAAFPKATVIWTHREPRKAAASLCSLCRGIWSATLREDRARGQPPTYDAAVVDYLGKMLDRAVDYRTRHPNARIIDVPNERLREDPLSVVHDVYAFAEATLSPQARAAMVSFLAEQMDAAGKRGHTYDLADFGLDPTAIDARFRKYTSAPFFPRS